MILLSMACDLLFAGSICPGGSTKPHQKNSVPSNLRGLWDFEETHLLNEGSGDIIESEDSTFGQTQRGPAYVGDGLSAYFDGNSFIALDHNQNEFNVKAWSYLFWFYFVTDGGGSSKSRTSCPILQKGVDELTRPIYNRAPAIYLNQRSRILEIYIDQTNADQGTNKITMSSAARIQGNQWTHIGVINTSAKVKLYVNGVLDNIQVLETALKFNMGQLFIGGVPWLRDDCSLKMYLDKVSYFDSEQKAFYIQAEAQPALGLVEAASVHMGCIACSMEQASEACIRGYHLCTSLEIYSGVYNLIKSLGWIEWDANLWTYNMLYMQPEGSGIEKQNSGTAICCLD